MRSPDCTVPLSLPASDRSPEERLLAVLRQSDRDRAYCMFHQVRDEFLERRDGARAAILAARRIQARQLISANVVVYIAACLFGPLTLRRRREDPELCRLEDEISRLTTAYLAEGRLTFLDETPPDVAALWVAVGARTRALRAQRMREAGCVGLARLWERDRAEFRRRTRRGGIELWGEDMVFDELAEEMFLGE